MSRRTRTPVRMDGNAEKANQPVASGRLPPGPGRYSLRHMDSTGEPRTLLSRIGHNFLTGLFLLLPIGITLAVLFFLMDLIGRYVQPLTEFAAEHALTSLGQPIPDLSAGLWHNAIVVVSALVMAALLTVVGFVSKRLFGKLLRRWFSRVVERVPGLSALYGSIRQMVDALSGQNKEMFRRVVLVEFPRPGCWSIGFVTHEQPEAFSAALGRQVVNVFVPNAPAPTAGFILQVEPGQIRETELGVSQAIGLLVSFGAVMPKAGEDRD